MCTIKQTASKLLNTLLSNFQKLSCLSKCLISSSSECPEKARLLATSLELLNRTRNNSIFPSMLLARRHLSRYFSSLLIRASGIRLPWLIRLHQMDSWFCLIQTAAQQSLKEIQHLKAWNLRWRETYESRETRWQKQAGATPNQMEQKKVCQQNKNTWWDCQHPLNCKVLPNHEYQKTNL